MKNPLRSLRAGFGIACALAAFVAGVVYFSRPITAPATKSDAVAVTAQIDASAPGSASAAATTDSSVSAPIADESAAAIVAAAPAPTAPTAAELEIFARFDGWMKRYLAASPDERAALLAEGRELAAQRRTILARLIRFDPYRALTSAVPVVARQQLPAEIVALLEERISTRGRLGVMGVVSASEGSAPIRRTLELASGEFYEAFVFGRRTAQHTTPSINASGIAVDRVVALDERPLRVLEAGEIPSSAQPAVETCAISGRSTAVPRTTDNQLPAINNDTPAVEISGTIHYLCSGGHIAVLEEQLIAAEGGTGGGIKPTSSVSSSQSTGVRALLFIRAAFPETRREFLSETAAYTMVKDTNDWFVNSSYGNLYLVPTVTPLIILPHTEAWYLSGSANDFNLRNDAIAAARSQGYDADQYDLDVVSWSGGPGGYGGQAYIGARGVWMKSTSAGVLVHELGHNFGVVHANTWQVTESPIGNGTHVEYGNPFDTMGPANIGDRHFNAQFKSVMNWLPRGPFVHRAAASGTYRIHAFDQPVLDAVNRYAIQIPKDEREYWVEFRQLPHSSNAWLPNGVLINVSPWALSEGGTHLLDMTPGSADTANDAALIIGRTFSDFDAGIHITPIGKGGTVPQSMDVVVNLGSFPGNSAPVMSSLTASATTVATSTLVNFTATATDANGDALSYYWDFGDKTFGTSNTATQSKSWSVAGDYAVRCIVSDMKGGTSSRTVVIRVGSPTTFRITGTVLSGATPLANVRIHNGLTGTSYRAAYTDSDGTYQLVNIAAGSVTLSGSSEGFTFAPNGFSNPLNVVANVSGANFAATDTPAVTITATDADAIETTANSGQITLTRTGSTASALTVRILRPSGTATFNTDYTLAPALTTVTGETYFTVSIPAGSASLNLVLTPSNDTSAEGPEIATFVIIPATGYRVTSPAFANVVINDDDTALPRVALDIVQNTGREGVTNPSFRVRRTGSTAASLNVSVSLTGTATVGSDYTALPSPIVIPAGASELLVPINLVDDATPEAGETINVTLNTSAAYVRSTTAAEFLFTLDVIDDDTPTVSVAATDSSASEAGPDSGVFTISRTGSTSLPLTVNYAVGGTALQNTDYQPVAGILTIPAGASSGTVTIVPVDDGIGEPTENVILQIRGGSAYVTGSSSAATINITDNSDLPVVTVGVGSGTPAEPSTTGTFVVTARSSLAGTMTVKYTITGTATAGSDYTTLPGTLVMNRNGTSTITLTPLDDILLEGYETVTLTLTPDPAYQLFFDTSTTLAIADNDQNVVNVTQSEISPTESGTAATFFFSRIGATTSDITVNYTMSGTATPGVDYPAPTGSVTIPAGQTSATLAIIPTNDALPEGNETITVTLAAGTGYGFGLASATHQLIDNDALPVSVGFAGATGTGSETIGTTSIIVNLSAAAPAGGVRVECNLSGGSALPNIDYQFTNVVLNFAAGETSKTVPLTVLNDVYREPSQTVILKLQYATGASVSAGTFTYTITDDDTNVVSITALTPNTGEYGLAPGVFQLTRTGSTALELSVKLAFSGTATNGTDYTSLTGPWIFSPGQSSIAIPVVALSDQLAEGSETVIASLLLESGYTVGGPSSATVNIADRPMDAWRLAKFGANANIPTIGGDLADPEGDGLVNLMEYLTGNDPLAMSLAPVVAIEGSELTLTYPRALAAVDVAPAIQVATSLTGSWTVVVPAEEIVSDNGTIRVIKAKVPLDPGVMQFIRLRATKL